MGLQSVNDFRPPFIMAGFIILIYIVEEAFPAPFLKGLQTIISSMDFLKRLQTSWLLSQLLFHFSVTFSVTFPIYFLSYFLSYLLSFFLFYFLGYFLSSQLITQKIFSKKKAFQMAAYILKTFRLCIKNFKLISISNNFFQSK